jgi:hypothetical protein
LQTESHLSMQPLMIYSLFFFASISSFNPENHNFKVR